MSHGGKRKQMAHHVMRFVDVRLDQGDVGNAGSRQRMSRTVMPPLPAPTWTMCAKRILLVVFPLAGLRPQRIARICALAA